MSVLPLDAWGETVLPLVGVGGTGLVLATCLDVRAALLLDLDVAALVPTAASSALL
jgi:hypothetical protein